MNANGTGHSDDPIKQSLRESIEHERRRRAEAEALVAASREHERRLQKALDALEGPAQKRHPRTPSAGDWQISDEKVEEVFRRFVALREQDPSVKIGPSYLANHTPGLSHESARRALGVLREHERVRVSGKLRGGGMSYDLMPDGS